MPISPCSRCVSGNFRDSRQHFRRTAFGWFRMRFAKTPTGSGEPLSASFAVYGALADALIRPSLNLEREQIGFAPFLLPF